MRIHRCKFRFRKGFFYGIEFDFSTVDACVDLGVTSGALMMVYQQAWVAKCLARHDQDIFVRYFAAFDLLIWSRYFLKLSSMSSAPDCMSPMSV